MPNSGPGGCPGTRVMIICVFYVSAQIPNIEYFEVYRGLQAPGGISSFFSVNFPSNAVRIMSGDLTAPLNLRTSFLRSSLPPFLPSFLPPLPSSKNLCFYEYGHNSGQKWVSRHDSDGIQREIS